MTDLKNLQIGEVVFDPDDRSITIDGHELDPISSRKICDHSPDGFNWGYGGSGPAQSALAILLALTDRQTAQTWYQRFKFEVVATLPQGERCTIPVREIRLWLDRKILKERYV